jgi:hypothetical protein
MKGLEDQLLGEKFVVYFCWTGEKKKCFWVLNQIPLGVYFDRKYIF